MKQLSYIAVLIFFFSCTKPETTSGGQAPQRDDDSYGEHSTWTDDSANSF